MVAFKKAWAGCGGGWEIDLGLALPHCSWPCELGHFTLPLDPVTIRVLDKATLSFHSENECLRGPIWDSKMVKKRETKSMGRESRHHSGLCYLRDAIKHTASTPFPLLVLLDGPLCPQRTVDISLCLSNCNSCVPGPWNYLQFYTSIFAWRASQEAQW